MSSLLRPLSVSASLLLGLVAAPAQAQQDPLAGLESRANLALGLADSQIVSVFVPDRPGSPILASLQLGGTTVGLDLRPHSVRARGFRLLAQGPGGLPTPVETGPVRTLRGEILELPGSRVAASLLEEGLVARIRLEGGAEWWLQPLQGKVSGAQREQHVLFSRTDVLERPEACGAEDLSGPHTTGVPDGGGYAPGGGLVAAELGCDADFEYFSAYGSVAGAQAHIESVVNTMNLQYESEVGITHLITTTIVRTSSGQPYTTSNAVDLLYQFRKEWNTNQSGIPRDVAQLFTGKNLDGGTIGVAWVGVVCFTSYGYGLVQSDFNDNFACATDLSAHELGHNWNAGHCSCTSNTMNPFITCANSFHAAFTVPTIGSFRDTRTCLDDGGGGGGDTTPPAPPTGLVATGADGEVALDWNDNGEGDLAGYRVYRSTSSGGPYGLLTGGLLSASVHLDTKVTNGTTYHYVVTAEDGAGNESGYSDPSSATPTGGGGGGDPALHVHDVRVRVKEKKGSFRGRAEVLIVDEQGAPVRDALVTVTFTGDFHETRTKKTDKKGKAKITTDGSVSGKPHFTACVDDVVHSELTYDPAANRETCDGNQ